MQKLMLVTLLLGSLAASACTGGGCPWTKLDAPVITPATSCLTLTPESSSTGAGGCVNPTLQGHNACADALTFSANDTSNHMEQTFAANADLEVELDGLGAIGTPTHPGIDYVVPAMLGTQSITITIHATGGNSNDD